VSIECKLIIAVLEQRKTDPALRETISKSARIPLDATVELLGKMQSSGLVNLKGDIVETNSDQRLALAIRAVELGVDIENISSCLRWQEFERIAFIVLTRNYYTVKKNVRFKRAGRKWEMDLVACKRPIVLCIDCKHWRYGLYPARLKHAVKDQIDRTSALAQSLPNPKMRFDLSTWKEAMFIPAVLSLLASRLKVCQNVPVVPILQLQDFLMQLPVHATSLKHFLVPIHNLQDRLPGEP